MSLTAEQIAERQVEREKLRKRLNSGVARLRDGERSVDNMSVADMERRLAAIDAELAGTGKSRVTYVRQLTRDI